MFKSFSQSQGRFHVGVCLGADRRHFLAGGRRRLGGATCGASDEVPISAARFWSLDYLIFMLIT